MRSLRAAGYDVVAVNPREAEIDGLPCYPTRRGRRRGDRARSTSSTCSGAPDLCVEHAREAVAVGARCLWLQLGIANEEAGRIAHEAGLAVVMDRCTIVEHRRRRGGLTGGVAPAYWPVPARSARSARTRRTRCRRSTSTPSPATTRPSSSCPATRTARPGSRPASTAASRAAGWSPRTAACSGYTGTVDGVPVSVQTTMMGTPTTSIVVEELLMLGVTTFIRVGTTGGFGAHGDRRRRRRPGGGAANTGVGDVLGGGEPTAPTADLDVVLALVEASRAPGPDDPRRAGRDGDVFYDPTPGGAVRWGRRGYLSAEMETAALYLLAMRERARAGRSGPAAILTVSDVIADPAEGGATREGGEETWFRPPEDEVTRRVDLTIGAALAAAAALGRG